MEDFRVTAVLGKAELCTMWSWEWNNRVEVKVIRDETCQEIGQGL